MAVEKAHTGSELSAEERAQYSMCLFANRVNHQQVHREYHRLNVNEEVIEAMRIRIAGSMQPGLAKSVCNKLKDRFTDELQKYVQQQCTDLAS